MVIRRIHGIDFVRNAKSAAQYRELRVHTELMQENETLTHFVERVYDVTIWRILTVTAIMDDCVYRLDDTFRKRYPETNELREGLMHNYEVFINKTKGFPGCVEDLIEDYKLSFGKKAKRRLTSFINRARKVIEEMGFEDKAEGLAMLCVYLKFCDMIHEMWDMSTEPLGIIKKRLPNYIPRSFVFLELTESKANKMLKVLDPVNKEPAKVDEKLDEIYNGIVNFVFNQDAVYKSMEYALKENGPE